MLKLFLDAKPLYYDKIDYTRMPRIYRKIKTHMPKVKTIHLIGTNGKGTTGRFLATALYNLGHKVLHYTSPHILKFNERIWLNGENIADEELENTHKKLQKILTKEESDSLSYFEYTTFLAMLLAKGCEYVVLEAGLGGENDATAVFDKELTLVTTIDIDHELFLGNTIESIATTKLNAMQKNIILGKQKFDEIDQIATKIAKKQKINIYKYEKLIQKNDLTKIKQISKKLDLAPYLVENLKLAISALKFFDIEYGEESFKNAKLFGRLTKVDKNILIDVGHNPLAAASIVSALKGKRYVLVYNSYKDKDYKEILNILKPIILHVEIITIDDSRIESKSLLQNTLNSLEIEYTSFEKISKDLNYLVFGSFSVVEQFLKVYGE